MTKSQISLIAGGVLAFLAIAFGSNFFKTIPAGNVGVATLFGEVQQKTYDSGLKFPVNPLYQWYLYDVREDTITTSANVPTQDQLQTSIELSVRFRVSPEEAYTTFAEFGLKDRLVDKQLIPALNSILRESGKTVERAEDFFLEETQDRLQDNINLALKTDLEPKGLTIDRVLIRSIDLPPTIMRGIEAKKEREQEVEKQRAELERFRTEQQQKIAQAEAEREAAEQQAAQQRVLADARAYEIEAINKAIAENPAYVQLQALEALKQISKDPSSKLYFLNGESPQPLPLMNLGEPLTSGR